MLTEEISHHLPQRLCAEINDICIIKKSLPEEIRIRSKRRASLTYASENVMLDTVISEDEMKDIVKSLCKNSVYAYKESIARGYISIGDGIRIGVIGSAFCENGSVSAVYDVSSVIIRIPKKAETAAKALCDMLGCKKHKRSCLIYASPGEGKTTLLRSAAHILSSGNDPLRVSVIDSRDELGAFLGGIGLCVDVLKGYPKEIGCEIATRTLNSQLIICDEIFGEKEAESLASAVNCGIPILCSAHAGSIRELINRPGIDTLHQKRVFDMYVKIERDSEAFKFKYMSMSWEEADNARNT